MELPRKKSVPKRYDEGATGYHPATPSERIRKELLMVLDAIIAQLKARFDQEGLKEVQLLEKVLLEEVSTTELAQIAAQLKSWPPELLPQDLGPQLHVFKKAVTFKSLSEAVTAYRNLGKAKFLLPQVKLLLCALLVVPASTATPERSFSALRRLKTWLRGTMGQRRLNTLAVAHVHRGRVRDVTVEDLMIEFITKSGSRTLIFGS